MTVRSASLLGLVAVLLLVATGCGAGAPTATGDGAADRSVAIGDDPDPIAAQPTGSGPNGGHHLLRWFEGELGPVDSQVRLRFYALDAADGEVCEERIRPEVVSEADRVRLRLMVYHADNPAWVDATDAERVSCGHRAQWLTVDLGESLGDRILAQTPGDTELRVEEGELRIVASSRPCGRVDCSTPAPVPAGCDGPALRQAIEEIDGGSFGAAEPLCDGSFLVLDAAVGAGGCLDDDAGVNQCAHPQRAFFVARDGQWGLVTYGSPDFVSCDTVLWESVIQFPEELCQRLASME